MHRFKNYILFLGIVGCLSTAQAQSLEQAEQWLSQKQPQTAFTLLQSMETELAGQRDFDYLYGQAALQVKQGTVAALAFERCLAVNPRDGLCRLGMVQAHILLQEQSSALQEIQYLQQANPPQAIQQALNSYMDVLAGLEGYNQDSRWGSYMQVGVGSDSNFNNATSLSNMAIPAFGGLDFRLSRLGRSQSSPLAQARLHVNYSKPLSASWRLLAEANVQSTAYTQTHRYNNLVADASLAAVGTVDKHRFIAKTQLQTYRLGGHSYRNTLGLMGQYTYAPTSNTELSAFLQFARLNYINSTPRPNNHLRTSNRSTLGVSAMQALANQRAVAYLTLYGGQDKTVHAAAPREYDYKLGGARVGGMYMITPKTQLEAGVGVERRLYQGKDSLFLKRRRDNFYDAYVGAVYDINRKLSIRPQYKYYKNNSNMPLYGYKRHVFTVSMRYDFF